MANNNAHTHDDPFWRDVLSGRIRKRVWRRRLFRLISPGARERCHLGLQRLYACNWARTMAPQSSIL